MNTNIPITVRNRELYIAPSSRIITYNTDYTVTFDFDAEWDAYESKTVFFAYDDMSYASVVMTGNTCEFPAVTGKTRQVFIGVQAGDMMTSVPCRITVVDSIADYVGQTPPDPPPDVYAQIMELINRLTLSNGLTDDEILRYLVETDTILTVTEDDGSLMADEGGNVLMW